MIVPLLSSARTAATIAMLAPASPATAAPQDEVVEVVVEVDPASLLPEEYPPAAKSSARYVREDVTAALEREHGFVVLSRDKHPDAATIVVTLDWEDYDNAVYRISLATRLPGETDHLAATFTATCIDSTALTGAVVGRLHEAVRQLRQAQQEDVDAVADEDRSEATASGHGDEQGGPTAPKPEAPPTQTRQLGALGIAGVGVGAAGVVSLVAGGVLYARRPTYEPAPGRFRDGRTLQPVGLGLMIGGGAALATGAVLLVVDRGRSRRVQPTVSLAPGFLNLGFAATF